MSSSLSEQIDEIEALKLLCYCNAPVKMRESGKPGNPSRRFVNCAKSLVSHDACKFFQWVDPPLNKHYRDTLNHFKALNDGTEVERLLLQLKNVKLLLAQEKEMRASEQQMRESEQADVAIVIAGLEGEVDWLWKTLKMVINVIVLVAVGIFITWK